jgi:hypothetical protein
MTVSFALLELQIQTLLSSLIREHQRVGQIIATQLSFARLRATVVGLYAERHGEDDDFQILKQLLNEANEIEQERNRITHSIWGAASSPDHITRIKLTCRERRGFQVQSEEYNEARFVDFNNRIKKLSGALRDLCINLLERGKAINNPAERMW